MMTELEIYNEFASIVLELLKIKRLIRKEPDNLVWRSDHQMDLLYTIIDNTIHQIPINVTTLNQFVKIVKDCKRFKPMRNNTIHIYNQYHETVFLFSHIDYDLSGTVIFDNDKIKSIMHMDIHHPYSEKYEYLIRHGIRIYFRKCVDITLNRSK